MKRTKGDPTVATGIIPDSARAQGVLHGHVPSFSVVDMLEKVAAGLIKSSVQPSKHSVLPASAGASSSPAQDAGRKVGNVGSNPAVNALGIVILLATCVHAQQPSVIQRVLNAVTTAQASGVITNNGQASHQAVLIVTDDGSGNCVGVTTAGRLEYSFDNSTYTPFGTPQVFSYPTATSGTASTIFYGSGIFPYLRFNLAGPLSANCSVTVWYTGGFTAATVQTVPPVQQIQQPFVNYLGAFKSVTVPFNGQNSHQMWMTTSNAMGQTCASTDIWGVALYGRVVGGTADLNHLISYIEAPGGATTNLGGPMNGGGIFNSLLINATPSGSAATHCLLNVWYAGSIGAPLPAVASFAGVSSSVVAGFPVAINQCSLTLPVAVTAGNTTVISSGFTVGQGQSMRICQLLMTTPTAAAIATLKTSAAGGTCGSPTTLGTFNMAVGVPVSFGNGLGSVAVIAPQLDLCLQATTGNVNGILSYDWQ